MVQQLVTAMHRIAYRRPIAEDRLGVDRWLSTQFSTCSSVGLLGGDSAHSAADWAEVPLQSFRVSLTELRFESGVLILDQASRLIVWNQTLEDLFVEGEFRAMEFLPDSLPVAIVQMLGLGSELISSGATDLDYSFQAEDDRDRICLWDVSGIRHDVHLGAGAISAMLIRPVALLKTDAAEEGPSLSESLLVFQQFDSVDRQICEAIAMGDTTSEIATVVGLTRRSVEVRRAKILERLQFTRPVEIVRLVVRLEENGLL
ncbi:LuxR C-terminal-related transcriptional regulator [Rhodopirellula sp. P2]|uniref:LuxR C-terminal-related transcriptional regulator n=1 Tax=Rhodopirellula sp. P2 TaxID=2127060 RepID=UPI002367710C|nr:LuxR C-terminal-related transcriptional regulator [Rhodopirellula sp. P2]WDQ19300.1 LuxR C-terminal-related transcriptional regulator [Rhodopirellula sp. P2]